MTPLFPVRFRVKAPVTRRPPHSPVREDFPHTVLRFRLFLPSLQPIRRHPDGRVTVLPKVAIATLHTLLEFGDTVCGLRVPPVVPPSKTPHPASPSLQWVAWASLPHLPARKPISEHRYYDQLRLPNVHPGFVRFWLSAPGTLPFASLFLDRRQG